jgi:hypothetical protein
VLIDDDRNADACVIFIVAADERCAGGQVEAGNVPVGLNQITGIRTGERGDIKVRSSRVGRAQVCVGEICAVGDATTLSAEGERVMP